MNARGTPTFTAIHAVLSDTEALCQEGDRSWSRTEHDPCPAFGSPHRRGREAVPLPLQGMARPTSGAAELEIAKHLPFCEESASEPRNRNATGPAISCYEA